jgi:hypothetical protein
VRKKPHSNQETPEEPRQNRERKSRDGERDYYTTQDTHKSEKHTIVEGTV